MVSIIMPAYNSSRFISTAIQSVIDQTYFYWELIVIDDCSTDKTADIINTFVIIDKRIKYFKTNYNSGYPGVARNFGIQMASFDFIAFLDSDDIWNFDKISYQLNFMKINNYHLSFTSYTCIDEDGIQLRRKINVPTIVNFNSLLKCNYIGLSTAMYNSKKLGKFYFKSIGHEDFDYWLNILKQTDFAYGLNYELSSYRIRKNSVSSNKFIAANYTWKILNNNLNTFHSFYYFCYYFYNALRKRLF